MKPVEAKPAVKGKAPDVFVYQDYRRFLRDHFAFLKKHKRSFTLTKFAAESGVSGPYISMVLKGRQGFSDRAWKQVVLKMGLAPKEMSYLDILRTLGDADTHQTRADAIQQLGRFRAYRERNATEAKVCQYLTKWYNVAIREMAALKGFKADAKWVQAHLNEKLPLTKIRDTLEFLKRAHLINVDANGNSSLGDMKHIASEGEVFQIALRQFHREMLQLCAASIESVPKEARYITAETLAIPREKFDEVRQIIEEARNKVKKLAHNEEHQNPDTVYQVYFCAVPLNKADED